MSIYSNVTEKDLINLRKLAEQQKEQRALKIKNRILKQTHDIKLAESSLPITKRLDKINESTQEVGDILKKSNSKIDLKALSNSSKLSNSIKKMIGALMNSAISLKITKDELGRVNLLDTPIQVSEGDLIKLNKNIYKITPQVFKALTDPLYTGNTMNTADDFLMLYIILKVVNYTSIGDRPSNRKKFITLELPEKVSEIQNIKFDENTDNSDNLQGEGVKVNIPSNLIDVYARLEVLLGLNLSGHTDTLTEASNLLDDSYKRGEIQNKQPYRNALNKFSTQQMELTTKLLEQIAFNTRPKIEEHMLMFMDKSTHEEHLSQPLQTNNKKFKIAVTFLTGYNGMINVTNRNNKFSFKKNLTDEDFYPN